MDEEFVDKKYLDIGNPHYILAQNFSEEAQEWLTHYNFAIGAIVDDPKYPKGSVVVPGDVWAWSADSLLKMGPFRGRIPLSVNDKQQASNIPASYAITKLHGFFESSYMRTEEVIMGDIWISSEDAEPFARNLLKHPQTVRFFDGLKGSAWRKVFPLYMVTGIKYANGLRYRIGRDRDWYDRGTLVDHTDWPVHKGRIFDRRVGIAYRIHEVTMDRRGKVRFDLYVDKKRATFCQHGTVLTLGASFT